MSHGLSQKATAENRAYRLLTLTLSTLNRARRILCLVTGPEKSAMLARLRVADDGIPAGRVLRENAVIFADRMAT